MFQALCYYYPQPDFTAPKWRHSKHLSGTFGLMTNVTMVSIPIRPLRDNHLAFFLATELKLLGSVCLAPPPITTKCEGKWVPPLLLKVGKAPVLWHPPGCACSQHLSIVTSAPVAQCFVDVPAWPGLKLPVLVCLSWRRLHLGQHTAPAQSRQAVQTQREKQIPSVWPWDPHQGAVLLCLWRGEKEKKKTPHVSRDLTNICSLPDSPIWPDQLRTPLI